MHTRLAVGQHGGSCAGTVPMRPECPPRFVPGVRRRLLQIPVRLTRTARQWTLHLPARWPWHGDFTRALARTRALPATG